MLGQGLAIGRETEEGVGPNLKRRSAGVGRDPRNAARERKEIGHPRGHGLKEAVPETGGGAAPSLAAAIVTAAATAAVTVVAGAVPPHTGKSILARLSTFPS